MKDVDDFFDPSEEELINQKEDEVIFEEDESGTIKNSKIKIDEFFDKKKIAILVSAIGILILGSLYFANQLGKNKQPKEEDNIGSVSTGTTFDINEAVKNQTNPEDPTQGIQGENINDPNAQNVPPGTPDLSQYDSQLGSDYNSDDIDNYTPPSSPNMYDDDINANNAVPKEDEKNWRKSAIGFDKGNNTGATQGVTEPMYQQQPPALIQQQNQQEPAELPDTDQNKQKSKALFLRQKQDGFYSTNTINPAIGRYELKTGSFIPAVLVTAINSDLPGDVIAQVRENVYDYRTGKYVLIPMGTKIIGKYDSNVTYGQNRVLLIWQRLVFPNGNTLALDNMQGVDLVGNAGLKGKTNNHFWKLMRSVLLSSAINIASGRLENIDVNIETGSRSRVSVGAGASDAAQNIQNIGGRIVEKDLNRQPTIEIKRGQKFNIFVSKDMILSPYRKN